VADAVASLLRQAPRPEVLVVNSGGGDVRLALGPASGEVQILERRQRLNPGAARNLGIEAASAPWIGFLAADCLALPGWVAGRLHAHRDGAVGVASALVNAYPRNRSANAAALLLHHRLMPETPPGKRLLYGLSYARAAFAELGPFRDDLRIGEDTEFNDRLQQAGDVVVRAPGVLTAHRNPTTPRALLRDLYMRGVRQARARSASGQRRAWLGVAWNAATGVRHGWLHSRRLEAPKHPDGLSSGRLLLVPAAVAYAAGGLAAGAHDRRRSDHR
jgi:GT2 family glycosyltransferase